MHLHGVNQSTKFLGVNSICGPQVGCFSLKKHTKSWRQIFKCDFGDFQGLYVKQMAPLDSWATTGLDTYHSVWDLSISKFDLLWQAKAMSDLDLTLTLS